HHRPQAGRRASDLDGSLFAEGRQSRRERDREAECLQGTKGGQKTPDYAPDCSEIWTSEIGESLARPMAGAGGFEPPHGGIKIRCLTTWLRPIRWLSSPRRRADHSGRN